MLSSSTLVEAFFPNLDIRVLDLTCHEVASNSWTAMQLSVVSMLTQACCESAEKDLSAEARGAQQKSLV